LAKATSLYSVGFLDFVAFLLLAGASLLFSDAPVFLLAAGELFDFHLLHKNMAGEWQKKTRERKAGREPKYKFVLGLVIGRRQFRPTAITPCDPKGTQGESCKPTPLPDTPNP
jgi:hypothetical protein